MQEHLIEPKGLVCDWCGNTSSDHVYYQVTLNNTYKSDIPYDVYLCTKCYKKGEWKLHE